LLNAWDQCSVLTPAKRAVLLAAHAAGETYECVESLSLGARDRFLFSLREFVFGPRLTARADCPKCGAGVESSFSTADISGNAPVAMAAVREMEVNGYCISFRLPNGADLVAVEGLRDADEVRAKLLDRCILSRDSGSSAEAIEAVVAAMGDADPQADIQLALDCPACSHHWLAPFDIGSFFWTELTVWVRRVLREVHVLASAYGWTEREILSLSPQRRRMYLEMAAGE
jgi:uncharacterized protein (UPF0212 family)